MNEYKLEIGSYYYIENNGFYKCLAFYNRQKSFLLQHIDNKKFMFIPMYFFKYILNFEIKLYKVKSWNRL